MEPTTTQPTDKHPETPATKKRNIKLRFGITASPERAEWGLCGTVAVYDGNVHLQNIPTYFSLDGLRANLKPYLGVEGAEVSADDAMRVENEARAAGFPPALTRFDKIIANYGEETGGDMIDKISGASPYDEGAGPVDFDPCIDGTQCRSRNCAKYGKHDSLRVEGFNRGWIGRYFFSTSQGLKTLDAAIKTGAIDPVQRERIASTITTTGLVEDLTQKDRVVQANEPWASKVLDVICGAIAPRRDAHITMHGDGEERHAHIMAFSGLPLTMVGLSTAHQIELALENGFERGMLDRETVTRLQAEIPSLALPPGSPEDPRNKSYELQVEVYNSLLGKSPERLMLIVEGMLKGCGVRSGVRSGGRMRVDIDLTHRI